MTIYFPDVSSFQAGIRLRDALVVAIKGTEGTGYQNPAYRDQVAEAEREGAFSLVYHFLHEGAAAQQAAFAHSFAGAKPAMLDMETVDVSRPTVWDACTYVDQYRARGGVLHWVYLPRWYWESIGSPSLKPFTDRGLLLWSSDYGVAYTDDDHGRGWLPYGGKTPAAWQYTSTMNFGGASNVDFSAFRGSHPGGQGHAEVLATLAEFQAYSMTGRTRPAGFWVFGAPRWLQVKAGKTSVRATWYSPGAFDGEPPSPAPGIGHYQVAVMDKQTGKVLPSYPREVGKSGNPVVQQFGSIPAGGSYVFMVRAALADGGHSSEWATGEFKTSPR